MPFQQNYYRKRRFQTLSTTRLFIYLFFFLFFNHFRPDSRFLSPIYNIIYQHKIIKNNVIKIDFRSTKSCESLHAQTHAVDTFQTYADRVPTHASQQFKLNTNKKKTKNRK